MMNIYVTNEDFFVNFYFHTAQINILIYIYKVLEKNNNDDTEIQLVKTIQILLEWGIEINKYHRINRIQYKQG
jgi:hypothetical protein